MRVIAVHASYRDVLCIAEPVSTMPNGDPDFNVKELERFFSALASVLESFAQRHNLRLEKYYHQAPSWGFLYWLSRGRQTSTHSLTLDAKAPMSRIE
jgi:hypothetical protein